MISPSNRSLLIASYCVMSINMALEIVIHPAAQDHRASITGLAFWLFTLLVLIFRTTSAIVVGAAVLNAFIALVSAWLILYYLHSHGAGWGAAPDLITRTYFAVLVPAFAVRYFVSSAKAAKSRAQ